MRNLRLDVEYDGTNYCGWQVQKHDPSISGEIEAGLEKILQHPVRLIGSGRTDSGVHALGQVANFSTEKDIPETNLRAALNSVLPNDIVIQQVRQMEPSFHARRNAVQRYYRYQCFCAQYPSALYWRQTLYVRHGLDIERMRQASTAFVGTHDFSAFRSAQCDAEHAVRTLDSVKIIEQPPFLYFDIRGNAFLRNQVRIMVGTLLEIGLGKLEADNMTTIIESKDRTNAGPTIPAKGLILMKVFYPEDSPSEIAL